MASKNNEEFCLSCDPKGVSRKVLRIERKDQVEIYQMECGHTFKKFFRTLATGTRVSAQMDQSLIINPVPEINEALGNGDYFKAATYLAALLEYYGRLAIDDRLRIENTPVDSDRIDRLSLEEVAIFLYGLKIID